MFLRSRCEAVSPYSFVSRGGGVYGNQYMSDLLLVGCCCCWLLLLADCCRCCCLLLGCCWCCCLLLAAACRCRCCGLGCKAYSFAACRCLARPMIIAGFFHCRLGIGNMISSLVAGLFGETRRPMRKQVSQGHCRDLVVAWCPSI